MTLLDTSLQSGFLNWALRYVRRYDPMNVLSPVDNKEVLFKFDGAEMSSDAGLVLLRKIEQQLGLSGID